MQATSTRREERAEGQISLPDVEPPDKVESYKSKSSNKDYACVVNLQASNQQQVSSALRDVEECRK